jgi:toxin HigB-1
MEISIENKELEKLYTTGKSAKLKIPEHVSDKFFATIQKIDAARDIYDLWADKGLNFEKLKGKDNEYSMRLSGKYRLEMEINWNDEQQITGSFVLKKISNHYKD